MTIEDLRPHPCGVGRPPTPSHHTGITPVVRAVWVAGRRRGCRLPTFYSTTEMPTSWEVLHLHLPCEWVHGTHPVRWFPDSESVGSHQVWVSVCASMLSVQSVRYSQGVPSHTQGKGMGGHPRTLSVNPVSLRPCWVWGWHCCGTHATGYDVSGSVRQTQAFF